MKVSLVIIRLAVVQDGFHGHNPRRVEKTWEKDGMPLSVFGCEKNHHSLQWAGSLDRKQRMKVSLVITRLTAV